MAHIIIPTISAVIVGIGGAATPIFAPFIAKLLQDNQEPTEPEEEYESVEIKDYPDIPHIRTKTMTFEQDKCYKLYLYGFTHDSGGHPWELSFAKADLSGWNLDLDVEKVVRNNAVLTEGPDYWIETTSSGHWRLCFYFNFGDDIEIYFKANETKDNMFAFLGT